MLSWANPTYYIMGVCGKESQLVDKRVFFPLGVESILKEKGHGGNRDPDL